MASRTPGTFRLQFIGPTEDVPRLIQAGGKLKGALVGLVLAPQLHQGMWVVTHAEETRAWTSTRDADVPMVATRSMTRSAALERLQALKAREGEARPSALRGTWTGELSVTGEQPVIKLERRIASYGFLRVQSKGGHWVASLERTGRWFAGPATATAPPQPTLVAAVRAGIGLIGPAIGAACAVRDTQHRAALDPAYAAQHPPKAAAPKPVADATAPLERALTAALTEIGISSKAVSRSSGPRLDQVVLRLAKPSDLDRLTRKLDVLAFAIGQDPGTISIGPGHGDRQVSLLVPRPRKSWRIPGLAELQSFQPPTDAALPICLGVDITGAPHWLDLGAPSHGHMLIGGATGSGKSVVLHTVLCSMLMHRPQTRLVLIDPKQVELAAYHTLAPVAHSTAASRRALEGAVAEMDRRYGLMRAAGVRHIAQHGKLPHEVVVVEELAELLMTGAETQDLLVRLAQKGRAAGVHLICTTQRPDATVLSGLLRANLDTRVALNVTKAADSKIILDEVGAERLTRPGDLLVKVAGGVPERLHGILLQPADVASVIKATKARAAA